MTTALDILTLAFKDAGVLGMGQDLAPEDANDGLTRLNWMLGQWQRARWKVWHLVDLSIVSTGAQNYTVGPGGQIPWPIRPDRLEDAFFRQPVAGGLPIDYPLQILEAREDYDKVPLKTMVAFSEAIFYDSAMPLGFVYPVPVLPANLYELHIVIKDILAQFPALNTVVNLPPEYYSAIHLNIALLIRQGYQITPPPGDRLPISAKNALKVIRSANAQIPRLRMPSELVGQSGIYNVFSDQVR